MEPFRYKKTRPYAAAFDDAKCAVAIQGDRGSYQCSRNHQPDNEWCKQHHPDSIVKRREASDAEFQRRSDARAAPFERRILLESLIAKAGDWQHSETCPCWRFAHMECDCGLADAQAAMSGGVDDV